MIEASSSTTTPALLSEVNVLQLDIWRHPQLDICKVDQHNSSGFDFFPTRLWCDDVGDRSTWIGSNLPEVATSD